MTVASNNSVAETIQRFEDAIKSKGWMVFTRLDHAAAAEKYEQKLLPRTVIVFGNPRTGTGNMVKAPTLAIDLPPKALVWQEALSRCGAKNARDLCSHLSLGDFDRRPPSVHRRGAEASVRRR